MKPTLMALCFCLPLAGKGDAKAQTPVIHLKIEQLTSGTKHHFFDYIGQCQTIPWNAGGEGKPHFFLRGFFFWVAFSLAGKYLDSVRAVAKKASILRTTSGCFDATLLFSPLSVFRS